MTTGAAASASADRGSCAVAWCCGPSSTPALPHCYFFISLVLAQGTVLLARPTAWTHSCCRALEAFSLCLSLSLGLCLWSRIVTVVLTGNKGSGYIQTHSLTQLCKPLPLWCGVITPGLPKGQMPSDHSGTLLPHVSAIVDERWTKWTGECQRKGPLITRKVWKTGTDMEDIKVDESIFLIFKRELHIRDVKTENGLQWMKQFQILNSPNICLIHERVTGSAMCGFKWGDFSLHFQFYSL